MRTIRALLLAGLAPLLAASAFATDGTWGVDAAGTWSTATNWASSIIPDGVGSTANLTYDITAVRTVTLNTARTVGILNIGDPSASPFAYTLNNSGGAALTLDNSGSAAQINTSGGNVTATSNIISAPLLLTAGGVNMANTAGGTSSPTISGAISSIATTGTQVITVTSNGSSSFSLQSNITDGNTGGTVGILSIGTTGPLLLGGTNSFLGGVTVQSGSLWLGSSTAAGAGTITLGNAASSISAITLVANTNNLTIANNIIVSSLSTAASNALKMTMGSKAVTYTGNIDLQRALYIDNGAGGNGSVVLSGNITTSTGTGSISINNSGIVGPNFTTLSGNNSFSGGVSVTDMKQSGLNINSATALGTGTFSVTSTSSWTLLNNTSGGAVTLTNNNAQTWNGGFVFTGNNSLNMGAGVVTLSTASLPTTLTVNANNLTVGGVISGASKALGNAGAGTLTLTGANSYTGATYVGGVLAVTSLANGNSTSNIGQSSNLAANLVLNRGTLQYAGGGVTTDRLFTIGNGGGTLDSSGSGALVFSNAGAIASSDTQTLTLEASQYIASTQLKGFSVAGGTTWNVNNTTGLAVGMSVSGANVAANTTIVSILTGGWITVNNAPTGSSTATAYTFGAINRTLTLTGNNTGTNTISGTLANSASTTLGVTKSGAGTWVLGGTNTYTGATLVTAGTLLVSNTSGSGLGSGNATVNGGTLGGSGSFSGTVTVNDGGVLAPGSSIQSLASGALTFNTGATFGYELDQSVGVGVGADLQVVTGNLDLNGTVTLTLTKLAGGTFADNAKFSLINYTGSWNTGLFTYSAAILTNGSMFAFNGQNWQIDYNATVGGSNFTSDQVAGNFVNITVVPEPATWALLAFSLTTVMVLRRRRE